MGQGYLVKCKKCNYKTEIHLGSGMMFPYVYANVVKDIKDGVYGEKWRSFMQYNSGMVVDTEQELYVCPECNHLEVDYNLSLYMHKQNEEPEDGYWAKWLMERFPERNDYVFVKAYKHSCPECGKRMHIVKNVQKANLKCPECGEELEVEGNILWD